MGGSNSGSQTVTERADPWISQQPYLEWIYESAQQLPQQRPYPFPAVTPFSPTSVTAMEAQTNRALQGNPLLTAGQEQIGRTVRGDYLTGGPGFDAAMQAAQNKIAPMVRGQFEGAGRYGGGLAQQAETEALGNVFAGLYGQERQRQMQAASAAPGMAAADYGDIQALSQVGAMQESKAQQALADAMQRWQFQEQAPYAQLGDISAIIQGGYPGSSVVRQQPNPQTSMMGSLLGGSMLGYGASQLPFFAAGAPATATTPAVAAGAGAAFAPYLPFIGAGLGALLM